MPITNHDAFIENRAAEVLALFETLSEADRDAVCRALLHRPDTLCGRVWLLILGADEATDAIMRLRTRARLVREVVDSR